MKSSVSENGSILQNVKAVSKRNLSDKIAQQIREFIETGKLQPSDRLPNERELAKAFQVSRTTVREAIKTLEHESVLRTYPGSGTCVVGDINDANLDFVLQSISSKNLRLAELNVMRRIVEPQVAALAAQNATTEDIEQLELTHEKQQQVKIKGMMLMSFDNEFHIQIANIARNQLLHQIVKWIVNFLHNSRPIAVQSTENDIILIEGHSLILKAIKEKDSKKAELFMQKHLQEVDDLLSVKP
jgi:GntR family transcriptional regulator, transcriptional repressor for pyruvate dehydrogenase complex